MKKLTQIRVPTDSQEPLERIAAQQLRVSPRQIAFVKVVKRSLDARKKPQLFYVYTLEVYEVGEPLPPEAIVASAQGEAASREQALSSHTGEAQGLVKVSTSEPVTPAAREVLPQLQWRGTRPILVGAGPGGLFAALRLLDHGLPCVLFERGAEVHPRTVRINMYWRKGELHPDSNVCFGEGGAGLFSDGKLITRIKSPYIQYVLQRLVDFGAPPEILYVHNPHVGSDRLRKVIKRMVAHLREAGCELHYETPVERLLLDEQRRIQGVELRDGRRFESRRVLLATGHSARDLYRTLGEQGVTLEAKPFAMGLRIEHPQRLINQMQLGQEDPGELGAAQYRLAWNTDTTSVYSFCMCPGGYVLSSGTEADGVVSNGMSNYHRSSKWANSALVVPVKPEHVPGDDPYRLLDFQRAVEHRAWSAVQAAGGGHQLPAQRLVDFLAHKHSTSLPTVSSPSGACAVPLHALLPDFVATSLSQSFARFDRQMRGFIHPDAVLMGIESRTSAPLRIPRDSGSLESLNTPGLYPVGEGAGYAGGITSAAVDGIRAVNAILQAEFG